MKNKNAERFEAAGWTFWLVVFGLLAGPCVYLAWTVTEEEALAPLRVGAGAVLAALGAGVVSWAVNSVLQRRARKRRAAQRKKTKAKKRK